MGGRLTDKFLGELERGRGNPTLTTLAALSDALDVRLATHYTKGRTQKSKQVK
jgi:transcriptional regulator with XRE-family HTH domain